MSTTKIRVLAACSLISALIVVLILGIGLQTSAETTAAVSAHCIDRTALARFQLARSTDDLLAVFGTADSPCRPLVVKALGATQHADLQGLIPAYATFFITGALALGGLRRMWTRVAIVATLLAAAANVIEDSIQLTIIQSIEGASAWLAPLEIATLTKFMGLAVCAAAFGLWALKRPDKRRAPGVAGLLPLPATIVSALDPQHLGFLMAITFLVFAVVLFGTMLLVVIRPAWTSGRSHTSTQVRNNRVLVPGGRG